MAVAVPVRVGQVNSAGTVTTNFLKVFGGEVLTAFEQTAATMDKHMIRTISSGKSAAFPATGKVTAAYHTVGAEIVGQTSNVNEVVIAIDDQLIADVAIPNIDEAMNHFDYRSIYSRECGIVLANTWDQNVLQVASLAARTTTPTVTGLDAGTTFTSSGTLMRTSASDLVAGIFDAVEELDTHNNPAQDERNVFVRPAQYYLLAQDTSLMNIDHAAGNGNYADGTVFKVAGANLIKTNNLPITNITSGPSAYRGDFSKLAAIVMTNKAVGTVKLMDLASEMQWDMRRQVTLILSKYAIGHGVLRPEAAVELLTTS